MSKLSRAWRRLRLAVQEKAGLEYELDGCRFTLPSWADDVKRHIRRGSYEAAERRLVTRWIAGDLPVIELGGAFGIVSGVIAARLGLQVPHVVVEADARIVEYARLNAAAPRPFGAPVATVNAAVAYGAAEVPFITSDAFLSSRLADPGEPGNIMVPTVTLGQLVEKHGGSGGYDLVCDIEGAEHEVFSGDVGALSRCRVAIVEIHPDLLAARGSSEAGFRALADADGFDVIDQDANVLVLRRRAATD